jgi:Rhs element Vgr protein
MTTERVIPAEGETSVVTSTLLSDGNELPGTYEVLSILTVKEINRIPWAKIVFRDGDAAAEDFELSNTDDLMPGKEIEIRAGYASQEKTIFKGIIIKHGIRIWEGRGSVLIVECRDASVKMTVGRKNKYFLDVTDSDVIEELVQNNGLPTGTIESTSATHKELVQYHTTDWDFMLSRADVNSMLVVVDDGAVTVRKPDFSSDTALAVVHGDTVYELEAEMDARHQFKQVKSLSWDYKKQEIITKEGASPDANPQGNVTESTLADVLGLDELTLVHTGRIEDQELQDWADARVVKDQLAKVLGRVKIRGYPDVKPGECITIDGVGERFTGKAFTTGVRHELIEGKWYTQIQFGLSPDWFARRPEISDPPAAGLVPPVHGLQIGVVTKLEGDPEGEDRIQVRLPVLDDQSDGTWVRLSSLDAGEERGFVFRPEIGDEVVVGFLNMDPRDAIVLGMLHSSKKPAPISAADDNHEKGLVTRGEMKLLFDDDKKSITIQTPGGNSIVLSDDDQAITLTDQHGNSVTLDSDGITLDGSTVTINSQQKTSLKAGTDLKVEGGTNVNVKAGAQFKAEGSAGAELSTSAIATVKGSLVKIN